MNKQNNRPIRIYIDHWEDYESIGDQAMLLNALRRLELILGPCQFVGPLSPKKAGKFQYPCPTTVVPPYQELLGPAGRMSHLYASLRNRLPSRIAPPKIKSTTFLDLAATIVAFKLWLASIGLRSVFGKPFREFLDEIKNCDVFFTVGDCSLSDYWLDGVALKSWLLKLVRPFVAVSVLSSQGIGPLKTPWARRRLVKALNTLDILSFRDFANSKALVESEGLSGVANKIVADEAFSFPVASQAEAWNELKKAGFNEAEPFIAVNFRNTDFTQSTTFLLNKIAALLDGVITATNKKIVFVCMSRGKDYGQDYETGISLKGLLKHSDRFCVMEPIDDISLVKGIIGAAAYSIGISYHLHVFSLSQGHPTLIVYSGDYYKAKSEGLVSFYGPPSRAVNFSETGIQQTLEAILEIEKHYPEACAHVNEVNRGILEINDWTITTLKSILIEKGLLQAGQEP